jgi:hypothetical protein
MRAVELTAWLFSSEYTRAVEALRLLARNKRRYDPAGRATLKCTVALLIGEHSLRRTSVRAARKAGR